MLHRYKTLLLFLVLCLMLPNGLIQAQLTLVSDGTWKVATEFAAGWNTPDFDDSNWEISTSPAPLAGITPIVPGSQSMWWEDNTPLQAYFRKTFTLVNPFVDATAQISADNEFELYVNGELVGAGDDLFSIYTYDISQYLICGTNVIAIKGIEYVPDTPSIMSFKAVIDAGEGFSEVEAVICAGDTYLLPGGAIATEAGFYTDTLQSVYGCDSVVVTNLMVSDIALEAFGDAVICKGESVQLGATGGDYYLWQPAAGLSDSTAANPVASPVVTTAYTVTAFAPSQNMITNADFEDGNAGFTSSYTFQLPPNTAEAQYLVGPNAQLWNINMQACGDHTTGIGNMLLVNGATTPNESVWCQTVAVQPGRDYAFSTWLQTLNAANPAVLQFSINGVLLGASFEASQTPCVWTEFYALWNSGTNTTAEICIVNQNVIASGNDFALDDISFTALCADTGTVVVTVNNPQPVAVNASPCEGEPFVLPDGVPVTESGVYTDTLLTTLGCDSIVITTLVFDDCILDFSDCTVHAPNIFSPNRDARNDQFYPTLSCETESYALQVFNRWGDLVFSAADPAEKWNGTRDGNPCEDGVYFYVIVCAFSPQVERRLSGYVTLVR